MNHGTSGSSIGPPVQAGASVTAVVTAGDVVSSGPEPVVSDGAVTGASVSAG